MRMVLALFIVLLLTACGDNDTAGPETQATAGESPKKHGPNRQDDGNDGSPGMDAPGSGARLTKVPDPCEFLTRSDAADLLGREVSVGKRLDAGGWNCVYDTTAKPRRRLVLDMYPGRDASIESTQLGITVQACGMRRVESLDDIGREAAFWRSADGQCNDNRFLWVVTDTLFQGRLRPEMEREVSRHVHFAVSISPFDDEDDMIPALREAAKRVLNRLQR